jgi:hypothetical protein
MIENVEFCITYKCNLQCKWCCQLCGSEFNSDGELSLDSIKKYIGQILPKIKRHTNIRISGGEPTLHSQIFEIIEFFIKVVRPAIDIPVVLVSNGVGEKVNEVLQKIRKIYDTYDNPFLSNKASMIHPSDKQLCIVPSKANGWEKYVETHHKPIFLAPEDLLRKPSGSGWSEKCPQKNSVSITPHGVFVCCGSSRLISTLFKLGSGENHLLSQEEENIQREKFCKYCSYLCHSIDYTRIKEVSKSYEKAIENWKEEPYYLKEVKPI